MIQINCNLINIIGVPVLKVSNGHSYSGFKESATRAIFKVSEIDGGLNGDFYADNSLILTAYRIPLTTGSYEGPSLKLKPLVPSLHIVKDEFRDEEDNNWNWAGHIDFMLFKRSLDGIDIAPILAQRFAAGSRVVATLMMAHFIEHFYPSDYGSRFYDHIKPFGRALKDLGFLWMPIVGADQQIINLDFTAHLDRCAAEFHNEHHILPSFGNECSKNGLKPLQYNRPATNNLWSRGSEVGDSAPPNPGWDWKEWHPRRDWPKVLFGNEDAWYVKEGIEYPERVIDHPMPCVSTEPIGFWSNDVPNRRSSDPNLAKVLGGTSIYFARGSNFMSEQGLRCEPWDSRTYQCALAFFKAINQ